MFGFINLFTPMRIPEEAVKIISGNSVSVDVNVGGLILGNPAIPNQVALAALEAGAKNVALSVCGLPTALALVPEINVASTLLEAGVKNVIVEPNYPIISSVILAKICELRSKAEGHWHELPKQLIDAAREFYNVDLSRVKYADNIGTCMRPDDGVTFEYEIFFPVAVNPLGKDLHWMLHELTHVEQYKEFGGFDPFLKAYCTDVVVTCAKEFTCNPHDKMVLETRAEEKANQIFDKVSNKINQK